jgi:hypothetical protein
MVLEVQEQVVEDLVLVVVEWDYWDYHKMEQVH